MSRILCLDVEGWTLKVRPLGEGFEVSITEDGKCPASHYVRLDQEQSSTLRDFLTPDAKIFHELWQSAERELTSTRGERFEDIIESLRYDGSDTNSLTVGEIRRALPLSNGDRS